MFTKLGNSSCASGEIRIRAACDAASTDHPAARMKLEHYAASRTMLEGQLGPLPLVRLLAFELEALDTLPPSVTRGKT